MALQDIPHGLTHSRVQHILISARFVRMRLQGEPVAPVEALPEILRKGSNPPASVWLVRRQLHDRSSEPRFLRAPRRGRRAA